MLSRKMVAFEANIALLMASQCCLWTFTFKDVLMPRVAARLWSILLQRLRRACPEFSGVRVFEIHPGVWDEFSHGLHVHLVSCDFFSDRIMNSIIRSSGFFGRWERKPITTRRGAYYIGKYLQDKRPSCLRGMRLQQTFGPRDYTRIKDIIIESTRARVWKVLARDVPGWALKKVHGGIGFTRKLQMVAAMEFQICDKGLVWNEYFQNFVPYGPPRSEWAYDPDGREDVRYERRQAVCREALDSYGPPSPAEERLIEKIGYMGFVISRQMARESAESREIYQLHS